MCAWGSTGTKWTRQSWEHIYEELTALQKAMATSFRNLCLGNLNLIGAKCVFMESIGEGIDRGWGGWMASLTRWTWVWMDSGSWWWTGKPGVLRFMGLQRVRHDWATELNWCLCLYFQPVDLSWVAIPWFCYLQNIGMYSFKQKEYFLLVSVSRPGI